MSHTRKIIFILVFATLIGCTHTGRKVYRLKCRHESLACAAAVAEEEGAVEIVVGESVDVRHAQARVWVSQKEGWRWLHLDGEHVKASKQDLFLPEIYIETKKVVRHGITFIVPRY